MAETLVRCSLRSPHTKGLYRQDPGFLYHPCQVCCGIGLQAGIVVADCDACDGEGKVKSLVTVHVNGRRIFPGSRGPRPYFLHYLRQVGSTLLQRPGYRIFVIGQVRVLLRPSKRRRTVGRR